MTPMNSPIPLRTNAAWGSFANPQIIPHRYGVTSGELIQYDQNGTLFVWADHACEGIDTVTVDGIAASDWQFSNGVDASDHAVCFVQFGQPQDSGTTISATGRGKLHPTTGTRLDNPGSVLWDVLTNICGRPVAEGALSAFTKECAALNLVAGGSIVTADKAGAVCREIVESFGGLFGADMPGYAKLWPAIGTYARLVVNGRYTISSSYDRGNLVNDLTLNFDFADGTARQSMDLAAPESVRRAGPIAASYDAKWIVDPRVAFDVAIRKLSVSARPQWSITVNALQQALNLGDFVDLDHKLSPVSDRCMVTSRSQDLSDGTGSIVVTGFSGPVPAVRLIRQSSTFDPRQYSSVAVVTVGDQRILTLLEADGSPIANAAVSVDGAPARYTDAAGKVSFPVSQMGVGIHQLSILTSDGRTLQTTVIVQ